MRKRLFLFVTFVLAAWMIAPPTKAQTQARSGKQVVDQVCASCHGTGKNGAPRIGDADAWNRLAARGLASLTNSALKGIRNNRAHAGNPGQWRPNADQAQWRPGDMPARGGNPRLTDVEIERAISHMIDLSSAALTGTGN